MKTKKRLLHICSYSWETGGPASFIYNHASFQLTKGVETDIASAVYPWQTAYNVPKGVRLFTFKKSFFSRFLSEFSWSLIAWYYKNRNQYDVIHVHGLWHFGSILPFLFSRKGKIVVSLHGFLDPYAMRRNAWLKKIFWVLFQKQFLMRADKLHAMNEEEFDTLIQLFPSKKNQIALIGNGIEDPLHTECGPVDPAFQQKLKDFSKDNAMLFLFLGRKSEKKGVDILLKAFSRIDQSGLYKAKLILAGPADDYSAQISSFLQLFPSENILELPLVAGAEKDFLYKLANVVVLPSYSEGFSIAALEAMAYGKASILSTRIGFAREVEDSQAGVIIEPIESQLFDALANFSNQRLDLKPFQENSRSLYLNHYKILDISNIFYDFIFI